MNFSKQLDKMYPDMKKKLHMAHINTTPKKYIAKQVKNSLIASIMLTILWFFLVDKKELPTIWIFLGFIIF